MKVNREVALELMALADGELEGPAKVRAERRLETDDLSREMVAQMQDPRTRAWLKDSIERRALRAGVDGIADSVLAELSAAGGGQDSFEHRSAQMPRPVGRFSPGRFARGATAMAALAAAIGLVLFYRGSLHEGPHVARQAAPVGGQPLPSGGGVELDEIDAPSHDISVFEISGAAAALATNSTPPSSVVIWIDEEPAAQ